MGGGLGYVSATDDAGRLRSAFAYARPAVFAGVPVGFGAAEVGLYAQVPLALVQSLRGEARPAVAFPSMGVEVTVLFGDFAHRKDRLPE